MQLRITVAEQTRVMPIPDGLLRDAEEFFRKMDRDMDRGWQMSREFVEQPNKLQRCQIAAHKLLGALSSGNMALATLMAGYILARLPGVSGVDIDATGEMQQTEFLYDAPATVPAPPTGGAVKPPSKIAALERAGKEVSKVYRSGHTYRYAVLDAASGQWIESAPFETETEAEQQRLRTVKERFDALMRPA
ncbi:MAG: hypothetical protein ACLGHO_03315 [Gammaproteobacteria bacterium]